MKNINNFLQKNSKDNLKDAFDVEAEEGFNLIPGSSMYFDGTQRQFSSNKFGSNSKLWVFTALGLGAFVAFYFLATQHSKNEHVKVNSNQSSEIVLKYKNDVQSDSKISQNKIENISLKEANISSKQISPKQLVTTFEYERQNPELDGNIEEIVLTRLPLTKMNDGISGISKEYVRSIYKKSGKETYIYSLKIVDYSAYRGSERFKLIDDSKNLYHTPADLESNESTKGYSEATSFVTYNEVLDFGINSFTKEKNDLALSYFRMILTSFPDDANALFYGALCFYNQGDYAQSRDYLERLMLSRFNNFDEEAIWYLALNAHGLKNFTSEKALLTEIIQLKGFYFGKAQAQLKLLK